jgi:hypothetical protein
VEESGARKQTLGHVPSYEASFRTFTDNVIVTSPLTGDAISDARDVLDGIQFGRVFTVIDALASPGFIDMRAEKGSLSVKAAMPPGAEIVLVQNGRETQRATVSDVVFPIQPDVRTARIEIRVPGASGTRPIPWLVNNPVYYFSPTLPPPVPTPSAEIVALPRELAWHVEKDPRTVATSSSAKQQVSMEYTLAPAAKVSQFAALSADLDRTLASAKQVIFSASAARPARISAQLRYRDRAGERWGSSFYVDSTPREVTVPIDAMRPLDRQSRPAPDPATASSLLFVADLTNAKPGDSNSVRIANLRIGR